MDEKILACLKDIISSIIEIESYFEDDAKEFESYIKDGKTKRAVERNLEIIGEAVSRILKTEPDFKLTNAAKIIATRNRIIHGYDAVTDELIWSIVVNHLPRLKIEVQQHLK